MLLSIPRGSVGDGITIHNFIRALPIPLITYNIGQVNSIGNIVYQAEESIELPLRQAVLCFME